MAKITKQIAERLAKKLTETHFKQVSDLKDAFKQKMTKLYQKSVPEEIIIMFHDKRYRPFFKETTSVQLVGQGFNHDTQYIGYSPSTTTGYSCVFNIEDKKLSSELSKENDAIKKQEENAKNLRFELENAFLSLSTFKRVIEQFPEAADFLDEGKKNQVAIPDFSQLREKLNQ